MKMKINITRSNIHNEKKRKKKRNNEDAELIYTIPPFNSTVCHLYTVQLFTIRLKEIT